MTLAPIRVDEQPLGRIEREILLAVEFPQAVRHDDLPLNKGAAGVNALSIERALTDVDVRHGPSMPHTDRTGSNTIQRATTSNPP